MNVTFCRLVLLCLRFRSPVPLIKSASYNLRRDGPDNDIGSPTALLSLRELNDLRRTHCCLTSFRVDSRAETFALTARRDARRRHFPFIIHGSDVKGDSQVCHRWIGPICYDTKNEYLSLCWPRRSSELGGLRASETEAATGRGNKPLYS